MSGVGLYGRSLGDCVARVGHIVLTNDLESGAYAGTAGDHKGPPRAAPPPSPNGTIPNSRLHLLSTQMLALLEPLLSYAVLRVSIHNMGFSMHGVS